MEEGVAKSGRKKKQLEHIGYDDFESFNEGDLGKITALLKSPKKSVKLIDKTMKGWNAGDAGDYCPGIEGQEDAYVDGEERVGKGLGGDETLAVSVEERLGEGGEYGGENLVEAPKTVDRAALQIG